MLSKNLTIINSQGKPIVIKNNNVLRLIPIITRTNELNELQQKFVLFLSQNNIKAYDKYFYYLIQENYTKERIVFFIKTELSSSSKTVKLANSLSLHPENHLDIISNKNKKEFLQSIFQYNQNNIIKWYYLSVGFLEIERNYYDCKPINIILNNLIPYQTFINEINEDEKSSPELKYSDYYNYQKCETVEEFITQAFECNEKNPYESNFNKILESFIIEYKETKLKDRDKYSNKATNTLLLLNNNFKIYNIYSMVKGQLLKNFENVTEIKYINNRIFFKINGYLVNIFVVQNEVPYQFIINGYFINGIENLNNYIIEKKYLNEKNWFMKNVLPYI